MTNKIQVQEDGSVKVYVSADRGPQGATGTLTPELEAARDDAVAAASAAGDSETAAAASAEDAGDSAEAAEGSSSLAAASASIAQTAALAAQVTSNVWPTQAEGHAATADGGSFGVRVDGQVLFYQRIDVSTDVLLDYTLPGLDADGRMRYSGGDVASTLDSDENYVRAIRTRDRRVLRGIDPATGRDYHKHTGKSLDALREDGVGNVLPSTELPTGDWMPAGFKVASDASIGEDYRLGRFTFLDSGGVTRSATFVRAYRDEDGNWVVVPPDEVEGATLDTPNPGMMCPTDGQSLNEGGEANSLLYAPITDPVPGDGLQAVYTPTPLHALQNEMPGNGMRLGETELAIDPDDVLPPVGAFETQFTTTDVPPLHRAETGNARMLEMLRYLDGGTYSYCVFSHAKSGSKLAPLTEGTIPFEQGMVVGEETLDFYATRRGKAYIIYGAEHRQGESDRGAEIEAGSTPATAAEQYRLGWTSLDTTPHGTGLRGHGEAIGRRWREIQNRVADRHPLIYTTAVRALFPVTIPLVVVQLCGANNGTTGAGRDSSLVQFQEASWDLENVIAGDPESEFGRIKLRGFDDDMQLDYGFFNNDSHAENNNVHLKPGGYMFAKEKSGRALRVLRDVGKGAILCPMPIIDWGGNPGNTELALGALNYGTVERDGRFITIRWRKPHGDDVLDLERHTSADNGGGAIYREAAVNDGYLWEPDTGSSEIVSITRGGTSGARTHVVELSDDDSDGMIWHALDADPNAPVYQSKPASWGNWGWETSTRSLAIKADGTVRPPEEFDADGVPLDPGDGLRIILKCPGFAARAVQV